MSELIVMVGLPGSGKSTICKNKYLLYKVFSSDDYRERLLGNENDQSNNALVFNTLYRDLDNCMMSGDNCILDAANVTIKSRKQSILLAKKYGYKCIAYVVNTPIDDCVKRDSERERVVGKDVIVKFLHRFQCPTKHEGFDEIIFDKILPYNKDKRESVVETMFKFAQHNHHHKFTLGRHCCKVADAFYENDIRHEAGIFHDIGKMYTQKFDENGEAHYYSHENVGAYILCCENDLLRKDFELDEILFYVNNHMHIRDIIKSEKAIERYKNLYGDDYFKLIEFMNADNKAGKE